MTDRIDSIATLKAVIKGRPSIEIILEMLEVVSYPDFVRCVNKAVDLVFRRMAENPELRQERSEDELTIEVVTLLRMMDIDASHESKIGGHTDVTVRGPNDFLWLAEAKKHKQDYPWLYQGYQQLSTRYTTGMQGQDSGGLLIFAYQARIDEIMVRWREFLENQDVGIAFEACSLSELAFVTQQTHQRTGRPLTVRHVPLSLYFKPEDKKIK